MDSLICKQLEASAYYPSSQAAQIAAAAFVTSLANEAWVLLEGDLGTGKTNWVKGMAKGLGIEQTLSSPSFGICNVYSGSRVLIHLDAYRLEAKGQWEDFITEDYLDGPFVVAIEWPSCLDLTALPAQAAAIYKLSFWIEKDGRYGVRLKTH